MHYVCYCEFQIRDDLNLAPKDIYRVARRDSSEEVAGRVYCDDDSS